MKLRRAIFRSAYDVLEMARKEAERNLNPYVTPEHVLFQIESAGLFEGIMGTSAPSGFFFRNRLEPFISRLSSVEPSPDYSPKIADSLRFAIESAIEDAESGGNPVGIPQLLAGIARQKSSFAGYLLRKKPEVLHFFGVTII